SGLGRYHIVSGVRPQRLIGPRMTQTFGAQETNEFRSSACPITHLFASTSCRTLSAHGASSASVVLKRRPHSTRRFRSKLIVGPIFLTIGCRAKVFHARNI